MGEKILGNRYEIIKKVGDGGMAYVYQAKDKTLNRIVALKVLRPEFIDDEEFLRKFKREAESVANLSHQNIVNVFDVGEDKKVNYIVMEYVEGKNLKEIIKQEGILDEYTALDITKQIASALSQAHRRGIIHRDIKPHNILISNEDRIVKVADFGIAKAVSNSTMTNVGNIIGSVHYFSPEQAKGKPVSNNADLYSLGIVLYEMLTGRVPFRGDSPVSIALQHINDEIEFTDEEKTRIPQSVRTIIKKLTEKSPSNRYQSAEDLIEDIEYIEKNIDLDFIKEYDSYATKKIDEKEIVDYSKTSIINKSDFEELETTSKEKSRSNRYVKSKSNKKLITVAVVLGVILFFQIIAFGVFLPKKMEASLEFNMPNLTNMTLGDANKQIEKYTDKMNINIRLNVREEYSSTVEEGYIISQAPVEGTAVKEGDSISLVVSKGIEMGQVPNLVGYSLEEAKDILKKNNLKLGRISYEKSSVYTKGVVIEQNPINGLSSIEEGGEIDVVVSSGSSKNDVIKNEEENFIPEIEEEVHIPSVEEKPQIIPNEKPENNNTNNTQKPDNNNTQKPENNDANKPNNEKPSGGNSNTQQKPENDDSDNNTNIDEKPDNGNSNTQEKPNTGDSSIEEKPDTNEPDNSQEVEDTPEVSNPENPDSSDKVETPENSIPETPEVPNVDNNSYIQIPDGI